MSERKVLNKYYPPDFDPSKIPRMKRPKNRQFNIRIMAPFNMRCNSCGEYIYKGKKFNSRQETVEDEDYLGLRIFRFYIKCPRCVSEITFKTDPVNTDYTLEGGASRNFEAAKTAEMLAQKAQKEIEEEELNNPMKVLENRTKASRQEMDMLETLQDLKELNSRHARLNQDQVIELHQSYEKQLLKLQEDEDEAFVQKLFGKTGEGGMVKRLVDDEEDGNDESGVVARKVPKMEKPTDILTLGSHEETRKTTPQSALIKGVKTTRKSALSMLVRKKTTTEGNASSTVSVPATTSMAATNRLCTEDNTISAATSETTTAESLCSAGGSCGEKKVAPGAVLSALVLLGNYSGSDTDSSG